MSFQWHYSLVDGIDDPVGLREEPFFQFIGRGDPVARTHHHRRSIEVVEGTVR